MDALDREILAHVQDDGRLTVTELAEKVRVSVSSCHRRLRALETSGAISGYRAVLDPAVLGLGFTALVFVTMEAAHRESVIAFETAVADVPEVLEAERLFGSPDYLLRISTRDLPAFQELYDARLAALPGVHRLTSTLVMRNVVSGKPLPL